MAALTQVQLRVGGSWWTDQIRHVKMRATHGATELTRRTLHYPLKGLNPMSVEFFVFFSFSVFKSVVYIEDFVHSLKNGSLNVALPY